MPYPADLPTVTVRHRIVGTDGTPARGGGRVTAVLTGRLWTGQGSVVPTQYTATVQEDGTYELDLPPVDHPDIVAGKGEAYLVTEPAATIDTRRPGRVATEQFHVAPVTEMVGQTVDVSDVLVSKPKPGGGVERVTITGPATDESLAGIIADPSSQTAVTLQDTIGTEVDRVATPIVADRIAQDETIRQAGAVAAAAAVSDQMAAAALAGTFQLRSKNTYIALGDSISSLAGGGAGYGNAWTIQAPILSQQRLHYLGNAGVPGNNSAQVLTRVPDVIAQAPGIVSVLVGTNDISQSVPFETWRANVEQIVDQLHAAGIRVVLGTIPPRSTTEHLSTILDWNAWLRRYAQTGGTDLLDFYAALVDPLTGAARSGMLHDTVHPSRAGHMVMAQLMVDLIAPTMPVNSVTRPMFRGEADNLFTNPFLADDTSSGVPTGLVRSGVDATFTEGIVTDDPDFIGNAWEVSVTESTSSTFRQASTPAIATGFEPGDVLLFTCKAKVVDAQGWPAAGQNLQGVVINGNRFGGSPSVTTFVHGENITRPVGRYWFTLPVDATTTQVQLAVVVGRGVPGASITARFGEFGIFNLTAMGLA